MWPSGNVARHFATPSQEEQAQKFYTDDVSLTRSGWYFWLVEPLHVPPGKLPSANQKHSPDLGSDTSSVWNFCVRFSDVILRGKQLWRRKMSAQVTDNEAPSSYYTLIPCPSNPRKNCRWTSRLGVARITFSLQNKNYLMLSSYHDNLTQFRLNIQSMVVFLQSRPTLYLRLWLTFQRNTIWHIWYRSSRIMHCSF